MPSQCVNLSQGPSLEKVLKLLINFPNLTLSLIKTELATQKL